MRHQISDLYQMQSLPLNAKIRMTQNRIKGWYDHYGGDVYCSFSGGKDSTVLLDIIRNTPGVYDVPAVFADTGLEFPEIREFVKSFDDVTIVRPKMNFREVIQKYGYPVVSKEVSRRVQYARVAITEGREQTHGDYLKLCGLSLDKNGDKSQYNCERWKFLLDAPFRCSSECCTVMKKNPMKQYEKETGRVPIVATMACESRLRKEHWLIHGCNAFDAKRPRSQPMSFWTEQDVLEYLYTRKIPYACVYGDIFMDESGKYHTTGAERTGCMFCMFGCHLEKEPNRFQKLAATHPKIYDYCIGGGAEVDGVWQPDNKGLGLGRVLDYIGVNYRMEECADE
ncbi:3'-phosphoadenosine 5'-phosphosulfate sulfotransferase (PAPS reductase)/FAD synthetase [Ruminococcus sp. YRD2003]|uniref:phosphoadenosine phosphosulfate reductase family protein n=1 Tax=Ruminococcus sp. YRD2003 TaxID=1452313 RepID=UPI0008D89B02|nr:3'-phosphoadenosine 5'-phosphosulfate sulfotransferase (PAPS reductase)/FAD synthetase [Ruminococcus flavefaciens]